MTREDLFRAIGQVEEERLARCENAEPSNILFLEGNDMMRNTNRPKGRILRNALVAALVVAMLAFGVLATDWAKIHDDELYENAAAAFEALLGQNGFESFEGSAEILPGEVNATIYNAFDRVPLDKELAAKYLEPYLFAVGERVERQIAVNGEKCRETLMVEANLYDASTGCGLLYYSVENPAGVKYLLDKDGKIYGDDTSIHGCRKYQAVAQTTAQKLFVAAHYINIRGNKTIEVKHDGCDSVAVELVQMELEHISLASGAVTISPIGMRIDGVNDLGCSDSYEIKDVRIRYADGTEYVVFAEIEGQDYDLDNRAYALSGNNVIVFAFNRIVDVENVAAVNINGMEYLVG